MDNYLALFEPDQKAGGYVVTFPDFGYGATQGESDGEAMEMARDLLMLTIGDYKREGKPLPSPRRRHGDRYRAVRLTALQETKIDLYTAFLKSGLKKASLRVESGCQEHALNGCSPCGIAPVWIRSSRHLPPLASACTSRCATRLKAGPTRTAKPAWRPLCWRARPECSQRHRRQPQAPPLPERAWPGPRD